MTLLFASANDVLPWLAVAACLFFAVVVQFALVSHCNPTRDNYWCAAKCIKQWLLVGGLIFSTLVALMVLFLILPAAAVGGGGGGGRR